MFKKPLANAITVLRLLSEREDPFPLWEISSHTGLSLSTLELITKSLVQAELVQGFRGPNGGYLLTPKGKDVTMETLASAFNYRTHYSSVLMDLKVLTL